MLLKDFECDVCHAINEILVKPNDSPRCGCGGKMRVIYQKINHFGESFNPHYDLQLGAYFRNADEKKAFLKKNNREQVGGKFSPRKSSEMLTVCTPDQYKRHHKEL